MCTFVRGVQTLSAETVPSSILSLLCVWVLGHVRGVGSGSLTFVSHYC